jgi:hypothetical protein
MQTPQQTRDGIAKQALHGLSFPTCRQVHELIHKTPKEQVDAAIQSFLRDLGFEASNLDILAHQMLQLHHMQNIGDAMARRLKEDDLPASFYNAYRHVVKDTSALLLQLDEQRIKENRKTFVSPENQALKDQEKQEYNHVHFAQMDRYTRKGYYYDPRHGIMIQSQDLPPEQLAEREIMRMRLLPKSPREDAILADALLDLEKDEADYHKINNIETPTDIRDFDPESIEKRHLISDPYQEACLLARRIFIERLQNYNTIWQKAAEKVDGLLEAVGIKIGFRHESVGLPKCVQRAAEGDVEAIKELRAAVAEIQASKTKPKTAEEKQEQLKKVLSTPFRTQALAIFLAFSSLWTCTTLVFAVNPFRPTPFRPTSFSPRLFKPGAGSREVINAPCYFPPVAPARAGAHARMNTFNNPFNQVIDLAPHSSSGRRVRATVIVLHENESRNGITPPREPAPDFKSRGLNVAFFQRFSRVFSDTG